jgi:hypothetical protein
MVVSSKHVVPFAVFDPVNVYVWVEGGETEIVLVPVGPGFQV